MIEHNSSADLMYQFIQRIVSREEWNPGFVAFFINPAFFAKKGLQESIRALAPALGGAVLDIGCGTKPYQNLIRYDRYVGLDIEGKGSAADITYDGTHIPFLNESFDSVLSTEVIEHVREPDIFLSEIRRILKQNGTLVLSSPLIWPEHDQPNDYRRYTSFGIRTLLTAHGFAVERIEKSIRSIAVPIQLYDISLHRSLQKLVPIKFLRIALYILLSFPVNLLGVLLAPILPAHDDLYLNTIVLARKR